MATQGSRAARAAPLRRAPPRSAKEPKPVIRHSAFPNSRRSQRLGQLATPRPSYVLSEDDDGDDRLDDDEDDSSGISDSDEDLDGAAVSGNANGGDSFAAGPSASVRRSKRKRTTPGSPATPPPPPKRRTPGSAPAAGRNANNNASTPTRTRPVRRLTNINSPFKALTTGCKLLSPRNRNNVAEIPQDPNAVIPPWESLPYLILVQIMLHASSPLSDTASVRWLLGASRTCRAFAEPAITALYRSPPLLKTGMAHNLVALLARPPESLMFNYHQKIEFITIDVGVLDSHVYQGRHIDFKTLFSRCPRLAEVDICHHKDAAPYRHLDDNIKWVYPAGAFEGLSGQNVASSVGAATSPIIKLKAWRWSRRMMGSMKLPDIKAIHLTPSFSNLQRVTFVNFQRPALLAKDPDDPQAIAEDKEYAESFAEVLTALPNLKHLVLESSTVANEILLPLLPKTLEHLELINCWDVTTEHFTEFLLTHGRGLRSLTLDHNQSLSLAFLPMLKEACPKLRALRMNLTYFSQHEFYNDSDPTYEKLLETHQIPTWPSSIQVIELEHLRHWEAQAAENLFGSLVNNAAHLPALRRLVVKAMLDIPWRQRSQIRDKWAADFNQVFRRQFEDPRPRRTLRQTEADNAPGPAPKKKQRAKSTTPSRRSNRIAVHISNPSSRASSIARELRKSKAEGNRMSYREPDTDEDIDTESEPEEPQKADQDEEETTTDSAAADAPSPISATGLAIQGLCDVVDVRFDNQKPTETQYNMEDFLDSDIANSDEEWTGDGNDDGPDYAW